MKIYRKLEVYDGYVLDPFNEKDNEWIYRRITSDYFWNTYGLTLQEVYNIANGFSKDYSPKCPVCGSSLNFRSLSYGYPNYCSLSCSRHSYSINHLDEITERLNSVESQAKGRYTQFLNQGNANDTCIFYLSSYKDGAYKFGVTSIDVNTRNSWNRGNTYNPHKIIEGSREFIGNLEYKVKLKLNRIEEYFNNLEQAFLIIREVLK